MTTTTLAEALTARTEAEILAELLVRLAAAGVDVNGFGDLSLARTMPTLEARALAHEESVRATAVAGGYLHLAARLADPSWLRALAKGLYQVDWIPASKARRTVTLTNGASGGPYTFTPRSTIASSAGGVLFRNCDTDTRTLLAGAGQQVTLTFEADKAGSTANGAAITRLVTALPGVTVADGGLSISGREDETNAQLVARCESRWGTKAAGGHASAYLYQVSILAPTVSRVFVRDDNPFGEGSVGLYLANASGPATDDELAAVIAGLGPKPCGTGERRVLKAVAHDVTVFARLYCDGSNAAAQTDAEAALAAYAGTFAGSMVYREKLAAVLMGVRSAYNVSIGDPAADEAIASYEVLTITPAVAVS